jgi:hypothetical protein
VKIIEQKEVFVRYRVGIINIFNLCMEKYMKISELDEREGVA